MSVDLRTITISNFRGIRGTVAIALDAPVVLLHGTNGAGKSTVISALELALTGDVSGVGAPDREHLVHRGEPSASIELVADQRSVGFTVEGTLVRGAPLLDEDDARFFGERCYLQQRTLGRLLDLYQEPSKDGASPLTVFVNDLLGLDELDALIDGLYPVTDKRRVKRLVGEYGDLSRLLDERRARIMALDAELLEADERAAEARGQLGELLTALQAPAALNEDLESAARWLESIADEEPMLIKLAGVRRELAALSHRADELSKRGAAIEIAPLEANAVAARAAADEWRAAHGAAFEALLDELREPLPQMPAWTGAADPVAIQAAALHQVNGELERVKDALASDALARSECERLDREIATAGQRLATIDEQLTASTTATAAEELGKVLATLVPHVHTDDCPVCGRDYAEISQEPLSARLAAQVSSLAAQAERLQELAKARLAALSDVRRLERERSEADRRRMEADTRIEMEAIARQLESARRGLVDLAPEVASGAPLIRAQIETERDLAIARDQDLAWVRLREALHGIAGSLAQPAPELATPPATAIEGLVEHVAELIALLEQRSARRAAALQTARQLIGQLRAQGELVREITTGQEVVERGEAAIAELERRRSVVRELRKEAEVARMRIVRQVFTNSLNRAWRDLFVRLAPEEPFVPVFQIPEGKQRVAVTLETIHRDGQPGGPPGAMLSAGNLNTAALTLFLALNLSAGQRLPWIVLDDPVQSMDEVHVAQFAALLRTLSSEHGRRVVIAVHERALFEYLALELSPAAPGDRLATVELSRAPDGFSAVEPGYQTYVEDRTFEPA